MIKVKTIIHTCVGAPDQWEGQLEDGRYFYIRGRHGYLRASVGSSVDAAVRGEPTESTAAETLYDEEIDEAGYGMTTEEVLKLIGWEM